MNDQLQQLMKNLPAWAQEPAVLIGAGVVVALLLLWLLSRLFRGRPGTDEVVAPVYEEYLPVVRPITPPPVTPAPPPVAPAPPPIMEAPVAPPVVYVAPEPEPVAYVAPEPEPAAYVAPEPAAYVATEPEPEPVAYVAPEPEFVAAPEPAPVSPYIPEEAPEPAPIADEPIAAAAPFHASPASIAADVPEAEPALEPAPAPAPEPVAAAPDELTRMKGVGPRLADRLNSVGVTSFAQIAALTAEDADALDAKLGDFQGRIHRDRWIEQAGYLANGDIAGFEEVFGKL